MAQTTLAIVGATGGAGTTRLAVENAAVLAREGRDVAILDAAYATQGLAQYVPGRIDPDATALALGDEPLASGLVDIPLAAPGRVACLPARAPFERIARAKAAEPARRLGELLAEAGGWFDHALVDVPPVAANQAVAAATTADRVALVAPADRRGADALPPAADRLADLDAPADLTVANRGADDDGGADLAVPEGPTAVTDAPTAATGDGPFARAIAELAERAFETTLSVEFESGGIRDALSR